MSVRVRFAPSPTGALHIGGVRTALYNYLFARKQNGTMILRIEDTDQNRYVEGAEDYINRSLKWVGIELDESPEKGGTFGPYRQSERLSIYQKYAQQLIESGKAYYAFDATSELDEKRENAEKNGHSFLYGIQNRLDMRNGLTLSQNRVSELIKEGKEYVIRLKVEEGPDIEFNDLIRGLIKIKRSELDDKVLLKSDGFPTYHLANIIDDHLMEISHVIRGEEWLPSTAHHILLYNAFGWNPPLFAHLPLILKPNGNGKLSKRDGDKLGIPVFPLSWYPASGEQFLGFDEAGFLPEAVDNFIALLGWNPGNDLEIMDIYQLQEHFSIETIGKSGSRFDFDKAKWINQQYILNTSASELAPFVIVKLENAGLNLKGYDIISLIDLVKDRCVTLNDFPIQLSYFFELPKNFDTDAIRKKWQVDSRSIIQQIQTVIDQTSPFEATDLDQNIKNYLAENQIGLGHVLPLLRVVLTGSSKGADLFKIIELLGKDNVDERIEYGLFKIEQKIVSNGKES